MENYFDQAADGYDDSFTTSLIGVSQRNRVYYWLKKARVLDSVKSIFEVNCGTGYDADYFVKSNIKVLATDASEKMISIAEKKRDSRIKFRQLSFQEINKEAEGFDAIFSNFGGLNCLSSEELDTVCSKFSNCQTSGNWLVFVIMPQKCSMEFWYHLLTFQFKKLYRRNINHALNVNVDGVMVPTYFHSPRVVKKMLAKTYQLDRVKPIAFFIPPSYLEPFVKKHPLFLKGLNFLEKMLGRFSFLSSWSDHYILIARKK